MFKAKNYKKEFSKIPDDAKTFPVVVFDLLKKLDLINALFPNFKNTYSEGSEEHNLLDILFELGRADLSVGRIIEGHINALLLIDKYGTGLQKKTYFDRAIQGDLFGIWNTEMEWERVELKKKDNNLFLSGAKDFCTGGLNINFAIINAAHNKGPRMVILPIQKLTHLQEDWSHWNPSGMRASVSCRIDFTKTRITEDQLLGVVHDYYKDPFFSWGAVRFSAVQLGGAQSIIDKVVEDLVKRKRAGDPYQKMRLGQLSILIETGKLWINKAEKMEALVNDVSHSKTTVNFSNMMRTLSTQTCEEIISIAEKAIGVQSYMKKHPMEKTIRDLRVYLKQAGPDMALANVGEFLSKQKNNHAN